MKYNIEDKSQKPAYMQLYEQLRRDILQGVYPNGSKLPSKRLLAEESGVSVITAEHAYGILLDEGYIESRQRSGYFIIYKEGDFLSGGATSPVPVSKRHPQSHGDSEFPFSILAKTMRKVISEMDQGILERSPNLGCLSLRKAIQNYLARSKGIQVDTDQIIIGGINVFCR